MTEPIQAIRSLTRAWIRKDTEGMSRWLTDDIVELGPAFPEALSGKNDFFRRYQGYLAGPRQVLSYRILRPRTIWLSPAVAQIHFSYTLRTGIRGKTEDSHGKESIVVVRSGRQWRVRFIHWHRDGERPETGGKP